MSGMVQNSGCTSVDVVEERESCRSSVSPHAEAAARQTAQQDMRSVFCVVAGMIETLGPFGAEG